MYIFTMGSLGHQTSTLSPKNVTEVPVPEHVLGKDKIYHPDTGYLQGMADADPPGSMELILCDRHRVCGQCRPAPQMPCNDRACPKSKTGIPSSYLLRIRHIKILSHWIEKLKTKFSRHSALSWNALWYIDYANGHGCTYRITNCLLWCQKKSWLFNSKIQCFMCFTLPHLHNTTWYQQPKHSLISFLN